MIDVKLPYMSSFDEFSNFYRDLKIVFRFTELAPFEGDTKIIGFDSGSMWTSIAMHFKDNAQVYALVFDLYAVSICTLTYIRQQKEAVESVSKYLPKNQQIEITEKITLDSKERLDEKISTIIVERNISFDKDDQEFKAAMLKSAERMIGLIDAGMELVPAIENDEYRDIAEKSKKAVAEYRALQLKNPDLTAIEDELVKEDTESIKSAE